MSRRTLIVALGLVLAGCGSSGSPARTVTVERTTVPATVATSSPAINIVDCATLEATMNKQIDVFNAAASAHDGRTASTAATAISHALLSASTASGPGTPASATLTQTAIAWTGLALAITVTGNPAKIAAAEAGMKTADAALNDVCPTPP
jgi:hypothetical protein